MKLRREIGLDKEVVYIALQIKFVKKLVDTFFLIHIVLPTHIFHSYSVALVMPPIVEKLKTFNKRISRLLIHLCTAYVVNDTGIMCQRTCMSGENSYFKTVDQT